MAPSLRDLELFVAIIDAGSITAGARAVGLSLSSASSRIALLERQEGVELLSRRRGGIVPTAAGTTLAIHARALLERADELRQAMDGLRGDSAREIRLASNTSAVDTLTEFLAATLARFPTMRIAVVETSSVEVASRVREGGADLGIASLPPTGDALIARELWADPLVVVRGSVFRGDDVAPSFEEVMRGPLIGLPAANPLQTLIDEQARILGVSPAYRVRLPTLNAVYAVASTGAGAAIVPYGTASRSRTLPYIRWQRNGPTAAHSSSLGLPTFRPPRSRSSSTRFCATGMKSMSPSRSESSSPTHPLSEPAAGSEPDTRSTPVGARAVRQARKGPRHRLVSAPGRNDSPTASAHRGRSHIRSPRR